MPWPDRGEAWPDWSRLDPPLTYVAKINSHLEAGKSH